MTEYYVWSRRPDVCHVGGHVAEGIETLWLSNPDWHPDSPGLVVAKIAVAVCSLHRGELEANGVRGFVYMPDP